MIPLPIAAGNGLVHVEAQATMLAADSTETNPRLLTAEGQDLYRPHKVPMFFTQSWCRRTHAFSDFIGVNFADARRFWHRRREKAKTCRNKARAEPAVRLSGCVPTTVAQLRSTSKRARELRLVNGSYTVEVAR